MSQRSHTKESILSIFSAISLPNFHARSYLTILLNVFPPISNLWRLPLFPPKKEQQISHLNTRNDVFLQIHIVELTKTPRMKKKTVTLLLTLFAIYLCGCHAKADNNIHTTQFTDTITTFVFPTIPEQLTKPEERATYLVQHYWDNTNLADTNYVHHPEVTEQAWANYCDLFRFMKSKDIQKALQTVIQKVTINEIALHYFIGLAEKYLYDVNSPMRNDEYYLYVLNAIIDDGSIGESEKMRPHAIRELLLRNRVGTKATDFHILTDTNKKTSLYGLLESSYTLVIFYDPECEECTETITKLAASEIIDNGTKAKKLTVIAVYTDSEENRWKSKANILPAGWINTFNYDGAIVEHSLYDLRVLPRLYLLDDQCSVILKDTSPESVEQYLNDK